MKLINDDHFNYVFQIGNRVALIDKLRNTMEMFINSVEDIEDDKVKINVTLENIMGDDDVKGFEIYTYVTRDTLHQFVKVDSREGLSDEQRMYIRFLKPKDKILVLTSWDEIEEIAEIVSLNPVSDSPRFMSFTRKVFNKDGTEKGIISSAVSLKFLERVYKDVYEV